MSPSPLVAMKPGVEISTMKQVMISEMGFTRRALRKFDEKVNIELANGYFKMGDVQIHGLLRRSYILFMYKPVPFPTTCGAEQPPK